MSTSWKQDDVFPVIARIINEAYASQHRLVLHDEIVRRLLADGEAASIIDEARQQQDIDHSSDWFAHNMLAWFSQRITVDKSDWADTFHREKVDGKWAYAPIAAERWPDTGVEL
ncbi:MAG: hypothetical protein GXX96_31885 [Planctomycetaceae bacterium]|jgi:hypothetical protein|nr:hypothetical protein [Planctomycetaceae bacterium]